MTPESDAAPGEDAPSTEGWAWPSNARKAHYYGTDRRSLCGRWALLFWGGTFDPDNGPSADDCAGCRKALDKRAARTGRSSAVGEAG